MNGSWSTRSSPPRSLGNAVGWNYAPSFSAKAGVEETLPYRIVGAIVDLERYRGAGRRVELSNAEQRLTAHQRKLLVDDSLERRADNAIRALRPRFAELRA